MRRGSPRTLATAALLGGALVLSACSGGDEEAVSNLPTLGATPSATTSASPSPTATATPSGTPTNPVPQLRRGEVAARTAQEKAVASAWQAYWDVRVVAYYRARIDGDALGRVAVSSARRDVQNYVAQLQKKNRHSIGTGRLDVSKVAVNGAEGQVRSCLVGTSYDVDASGKPVEAPSGAIGLYGAAVKQGPYWKISGVRVDDKACA
ncbi:hypothetical protein [Angustibacter aerolatus]